jgi:hypothetical protein
MHKQADGSFVSDPAAKPGIFEFVVCDKSGQILVCSNARSLVIGDVIVWNGYSLATGLDVFEEGKDLMDAFRENKS